MRHLHRLKHPRADDRACNEGPAGTPGTFVRLATPADIPFLFAVRTSVRENHLAMDQLAARGVTPDTVGEMLEDELCRTWVVDGPTGVCGFSMADGRSGSVFALFVGPGAEARGFGRTLLRAAEEWLFEMGWSTIWLQTGAEPGNRAHRLYRAAGWTMVGPADHGDVRYEKSRNV